MVERTRADRIYAAKLAEQAERYEDMANEIREIVKEPQELSEEERNLMSVAFKNIVGSFRSSWRILSSFENKSGAEQENAQLTAEYRKKIEDELEKTCTDVLEICDKYLIPLATTPEATIFYKKMKGDYYRYLGEVKVHAEREKVANLAYEAYSDAFEQCKTDLPETHPIRLGLGLNFSVFYYEIWNKPDMAMKLAKSAFDDAISKINDVSDEVSKDSTLILQLLRDNLTLWTSEGSQEQQNMDEE